VPRSRMILAAADNLLCTPAAILGHGEALFLGKQLRKATDIEEPLASAASVASKPKKGFPSQKMRCSPCTVFSLRSLTVLRDAGKMMAEA